MSRELFTKEQIQDATRRWDRMFLESGAFQKGTFTLASGKTSDTYVDCRKLTMQSECVVQVAQAIKLTIIAEIRQEAPFKLAGVAEGGIPLVAACLATFAPGGYADWSGGWIRKQAKEHGVGKRLAGCLEPGDTVVLLEDVITSGGSVIEAYNTLQEENIAVEAIISLLDRSDGSFVSPVPYYPLTTIDRLNEAYDKSQR